MKKAILFGMVMLCLLLSAMAQQSVSGKITDANGLPLAGVSVKSLKTGKLTTTGNDGSFTIATAANDEFEKLEISMVGYLSQIISINGPLNIILVQDDKSLSEVVLVGSRRNGRVKTETTAPVDVINVAQAAAPTARMDLTSLLNYAAPSFNYNKQSGSDGADHIDLATLRGLGPDQTLVLVNGKRRHQTAFVAVFGTRGRGNSGTDLNAIPASAIDRVEILRDGASAQ